MVASPKRIAPPWTLARPLIVFSSVVLPAPFGPTTETTSPSYRAKSMPFNICVRPYPDSIAATSSSIPDLIVLSRTAKIRLLHSSIRLNLRRGALEKQLALVEDEDVIRQCHHEIHVVLNDDHHQIGADQLAQLLYQLVG